MQLNPALPRPPKASEPLKVYMADNVEYDGRIEDENAGTRETSNESISSGKLNFSFECGLIC